MKRGSLSGSFLLRGKRYKYFRIGVKIELEVLVCLM